MHLREAARAMQSSAVRVPTRSDIFVHLSTVPPGRVGVSICAFVPAAASVSVLLYKPTWQLGHRLYQLSFLFGAPLTADLSDASWSVRGGRKGVHASIFRRRHRCNVCSLRCRNVADLSLSSPLLPGHVWRGRLGVLVFFLNGSARPFPFAPALHLQADRQAYADQERDSNLQVDWYSVSLQK